MNRRNRTVIVLLVAILLAGAASYAVYRTITQMPVREVEVATMHVAVAADNLSMGTRITKDHVDRGWPASNPSRAASLGRRRRRAWLIQRSPPTSRGPKPTCGRFEPVRGCPLRFRRGCGPCR